MKLFSTKNIALLLIFVCSFSFAEDSEDESVTDTIEIVTEEDNSENEQNETEEQDEPEVDDAEQEQNDDEIDESESSEVEEVNPEDASADYRNNAVFKNSYEEINASDRSKSVKNNKRINKPDSVESLSNSQESKMQISRKKTDLADEKFECDPVISVQAQNKLRFDILKELADEHNFEIEMLESENKNMSLEKNLPLSKVVESITRDMSVVLNFTNVQGCKVLTSIAVLDSSIWEGGSSSRSGNSGAVNDISEKLQRYKPKFKPITLVDKEDVEPLDPAVEEERRILSEERRAKRLEKNNMRSLNDELENGDELNVLYNVKGDNWKKDIRERQVEIPDMQQYVQEVMDGERQPDMRAMTLKQRSEYMRIRRELRAQQKE